MEAKLLAAAILVLMFALPSRAVAENSSSDHKSAVLCDQTDYVAYRTCVHEAKRHKRQLLVPSHLAANLTLNANDTTPTGVNTTLHCQRLNFDCRIACDNDTNCESRCPVCPLNVSQLAADQVDYRTVVVESPNGSEQRFQARIQAGRNITTIIRLTNILNNTNHIQIPTNVTTNNVNNINLHANQTGAGAGGDYGLGQTADGTACCLVVRPRTCRTSSAGQRCHNRRDRRCDATICKARVMHAHVRRQCNRAGEQCRKRLVYVPEPGPKKCVRTARWPFVVCGTLVTSERGEEAAAEQEQRAYRRGPPPMLPPPWAVYYRPPWLDCRYAGGCGGQDWGGQQQPWSSHGGHRDVYYEDEVEVGADDGEHETTAPDGDSAGEWLLEDTKCKVVSSNGTTVVIKNCTANSLDENEYATEPKVNFAGDLADDDDVRSKRHAVHGGADDEDELATVRRNRHRQGQRRSYLDNNYVDEADDGRYGQQMAYNRFAEDFEYDEELNHPYKRPYRRKHRRGGERRRRSGRKQPRKIVYDTEE